MRIAVNVSWMRPGATGGMEHYVRNLISELGRLDTENRYFLLTSELNHETFEDLPPRWERRRCSSQESNPSSFRRLPVIAPDEISILDVLSRDEIDLLFCPLMYALPLQDEIPTVVTIPDLQHEAMPENFQPWERGSRSLGFESSVRRAAAVLTISESVKEDVLARYGVSDSKVIATPLGLNTDCDLDEATLDGLADAVRARYRIDYPFAFYPANCWPHKNHETLVRAFAGVVTASDLHLILTGSPMEYEKRIAPLVADLDLQDRVHHFGYVSRQAVFGLYRASEMLALPSRFEGFGLPLLEAFRFGVPVACSNIPALVEVGGPAAEFFDPTDAEELTAAVLRVYEDPHRAFELRQLGFERLDLFNYRRTAALTLEVFDSLSSGDRRRPERTPRFRPLSSDGDVPHEGGAWHLHLPAPRQLKLRFGLPVPQEQESFTVGSVRVSVVVDGVEVATYLLLAGANLQPRIKLGCVDHSDPFHTVEVHVEAVHGVDDVRETVVLHDMHIFDDHYGNVRVL